MNEFLLTDDDREALKKSAQIFNRLANTIEKCNFNLEDDVHIIGGTESFFSTDIVVAKEMLNTFSDSPKILFQQNENFAY